MRESGIEAVTNASYSTDAVRATASGSKNQTIAGLFRTALKAIAQRGDDAPQPPKRRRRSGEKTGGPPIMPRQVVQHGGNSAARGCYAPLRIIRQASLKLPRQFARAARHAARPSPVPFAFYQAAAGAYRGDTLEMVNQWSDIDAGDALELDSLSDHYAPQP